jgi:hypothetical protein
MNRMNTGRVPLQILRHQRTGQKYRKSSEEVGEYEAVTGRSPAVTRDRRNGTRQSCWYY